MFESLQAFIPVEWRAAFAALAAPIAWIPDWHAAMVNFAWYGDSAAGALFKRFTLLMPVLVILVVIWSTMTSVYTLPFRAKRGRFLTATVISWWDALRSVWLFWAGMVRLAVVLVGWIWQLLRLGFRMLGTAIKATFRSPLVLLDWTSRSYFKPGVPWIAFLALLLWCAVESTIFMYTLSPTLTEVLAGITGFEPDPRLMGPILWLFLYLLILGSFACIHVLAEAIRNRRMGEIVQMAFVELFVMFFEVIFLYRELIDAITPWIAQQTGESVRLGLIATLSLASFGWVGVRGMTWFLFGRFGTPAVLAILARDSMKSDELAASIPTPVQPELWRDAVSSLKSEIDWFKKEGRYAFELLTLPVLQLLAAAVNAVVVVILGRPMFPLPFKTLNQALALTPRWVKPGEAASAPDFEPATPLVQGGVQ